MRNICGYSARQYFILVCIILLSFSSIGYKLQALFNKTVLPYLNFPSDIGLTLLVLFIALTAIIHAIIRWHRKQLLPSSNIYVFSILFTIYLRYRYSSDYTYYPLFTNLKQITYIDILILIPTAYVLSSILVSILPRKNTKQKPCDIELNSGQALDCFDAEYNYKEYINSITPIILDNFNNDCSVSIGVSGSWGSGKTSFLNALISQLKENEFDGIIIDFKPWFCQNTTDTLKEFFKVYREGVNKRVSGIDSDIIDYASALTEDLDQLKWINKLIAISKSEQSTQAQFNSIKEKLQKHKIKTIIVIDDLDRLDKDEIVELFRLIRITANFPFTQFILAYDKAYIQHAIKNKLGLKASEKFIDKMINTEISLPHFDYKEIGYKLYSELERYYPNESDSIRQELTTWDIHNSKHNGVFERTIPIILPTFRDVHRFVNMFKLDYQLLGQEKAVYFRDFLTLSLIKYAFPSFYQIMAKNPELLFQINSTYIFLKQTREANNNTHNSGSNDFSKIINTSTTENNKDVLYMLLNNIFDVHPGIKTSLLEENIDSQPNDYLHLKRTINYNKYFQFKTPSYLFNVLKFIQGVEDENWEYISLKTEVVRSQEHYNIVCSCFNQYGEQSNQRKLVSLIRATDKILELNKNIVEEIINAYTYYFNIPDSFNPELWLKAVRIFIKHDIDSWGVVMPLILKKRTHHDIQQYKIQLKKLFSESKQEKLLQALHYHIQQPMKTFDEFLFNSNEVTDIQTSIMIDLLKRNIPLATKLEHALLIVNYKFSPNTMKQILPSDNVIDLMKSNIMDHASEFIEDFISKEPQASAYRTFIYPMPFSREILSDNDIDDIFESTKDLNIPNYASALKLWTWIKNKNVSFYKYDDHNSIKTVDQWIEEGMPNYNGNSIEI